MSKPLVLLMLGLIGLVLALPGPALASPGEASIGGTILAPVDTFNPTGPLLYAVGGSAEEPNIGHISITYRTVGTTCQFDPGPFGTVVLRETTIDTFHDPNDVPLDAATLTNWVFACGNAASGTATVEILDSDAVNGLVVSWPRGAVFVDASIDVFDIRASSSGPPNFAWVPLDQGRASTFP